MNLEKIISVSGLPGLYNLVATRNNGLLVSDMDSGKTKFCSVRKHQFTPLDTVAIYTLEDSSPIKDVFKAMQNHPPVSPKSTNDELMEYFDKVLPDYDEDRVFPGDVKKVIKWYNFLNDRKLLVPSEEEE